MNNNRLYVNGEGYSDSTAGKVLRNINRELRGKERKGNMAKKRNCRRTNDENRIHEKAVKMRKMTDEQLVHYVENRVEKARSEGFNQGKNRNIEVPQLSATEFVEKISKLKGIGTATMCKIRKLLEKSLEEIDMLKIGDEVVMNDKYVVSEKNKGKSFIVASEPWNCCGTMVVKLNGYSGGYAVDGLSKVGDTDG